SLIISNNGVDPLTFVYPFTVDVYGFSQSCDGCAITLLANAAESLPNHVLYVKVAFDAAPVVAEGATECSVKLVHSLLSNRLGPRLSLPH
ncbi:unnamed protein product, partial [Prunus brigantina]